MENRIKSGEAIVLEARQGKEGGKTLVLFTREEGRLSAYVPRAVMNRCGTGLTMPFAHIRYTGAEGEYLVLSQYEGKLLFDIMKLTYEEMTCWYCLIETAEKLFPLREEDARAFEILLAAGRAGEKRNSLITSFIALVKLLAAAGFDASSPEAEDRFHLSKNARLLLADFRSYRWNEPFGRNISKTAFRQCAGYMDEFIEVMCDVELKTKGAFLSALKAMG